MLEARFALGVNWVLFVGGFAVTKMPRPFSYAPDRFVLKVDKSLFHIDDFEGESRLDSREQMLLYRH